MYSRFKLIHPDLLIGDNVVDVITSCKYLCPK